MTENPLLEHLADELGLSYDKVNAETSLPEENWDSLAVVTAMAVIDDHYGISVDSSSLQECSTVGDVLNLIQLHQASKDAA